MIKVFVTTFYRKNYGSALQAFALQSVIGQMGAKAVIIEEPMENQSFARRILSDVFYLIKPEKHYGFIKKSRRLVEERLCRGKTAKIDKFVQNNIVTVSLDEAREEIEQGNCIMLAGSDQIWNIINAPINPYFLFEFVNSTNVKKISYAASIGMAELSKEQKQYYSKVLKTFNVISFREQIACDLLKDYIDCSEIRCDIDPTLLLSKNFWKSLCSKRIVKEAYVFVYILRPNDELIHMAKVLAAEKNLKIIFVGQFNDKFSNVETINNAGVEDFLSYIKNAEYIITNSFHGTVFSILFEKKFVSVRIQSTASRVENLLSELNLESHLISRISELDVINNEYNIDMVECRLNELRKDSLDYLNREISNNVMEE